ncbi:DUF4198 domain-containing protein [Nonlabens xiamenensis]|uniref:DUF4198 domain-containing protein n=1 Tax=Nonlabens xiamenensis TaxID=2341043 RepID=UPI000F60596A|nr:DUF4198 domain-containing protein [Nonlabens xiamenensis]
MRRPCILLLLVLLLCSHDLYLKMETYFVPEQSAVSLQLYNGTFEKSENTITRDRMLDASIVSHGERKAIISSAWQDLDSTITQVNFNTGESGTYVAGVSTKARNIKLSADKFNDYLTHDGVLDMLAARKQAGKMKQDAVESYQKHVKAIYQVGEKRTDDWKTKLGYPIEFVPQSNPYDAYTGDHIRIQLLHEGQALPDQLVYADYVPSGHQHQEKSGENHDHTHNNELGDHHHDHVGDAGQHGHSHENMEDENSNHTHTEGQQLRTDAEGMLSLHLPHDGIYYLRTIYMTEAKDVDSLTHRSKWATLTFETTHRHDDTTHDHDHNHEDEGIPTWWFVVGSIVAILLLFMLFSKKSTNA